MPEITHWRAALVEVGRHDLAEIAFHNRGDYPSMDWCRFERSPGYGEGSLYPGGHPTIVDVLITASAMKLWYITFRPDRMHALPLFDNEHPAYWQNLVTHTFQVGELYRKHRIGECQCKPRDYGRNPELRENLRPGRV